MLSASYPAQSDGRGLSRVDRESLVLRERHSMRLMNYQSHTGGVVTLREIFVLVHVQNQLQTCSTTSSPFTVTARLSAAAV